MIAPGFGMLEGMSSGERASIVALRSDDLDRDRQAGGIETRGHREGRYAGDAEPAEEVDHHFESVERAAAELDGLLPREGGADGRGWGHQQVDLAREQLGETGAERPALARGADEIGRRDGAPDGK